MNRNNLLKEQSTLTDGISLRAYSDRNIIFESRGKWLYPLLELEEYIDDNNYNAASLFLHDKIAGRAAASLITGMGFRSCYIDTLSKGALEIFKKYNVNCSYSILVDRIACMTEEIITTDMTPDQVYTIVKKKAGLSKGLDLEIENLYASYPGKKVISGLNLKIKAGEKCVITGDNGAGKSTLIKVLTGVHSKDSGKILLDGKDIASVIKTPSPVAYVTQSLKTDHFPITAGEIVLAGTLGRKKSAKELRYKAEIAMRRTGCFQLKSRDFSLLSGGEKQRVSIARCLCQDAGLLLLDEPTSFLDRESKEELIDILNKILKREMTTVLLVSHDHEWIEKIGWKVQEMKEGKLCLKY